MRAIFISYRRDDAEGQAGRLFDDLTQHFGNDAVFMDVAAIEPGRDFRRAIDEQVASCGVLLALIGTRWLTATDESGARRLDDPLDFVRLETASALKRDIPVIPVLVQGARIPRADDLPEDLKELAFRNGAELTHARWDSDVQLLAKALTAYVQAKPDPSGPRPPSAPDEQGRPSRAGAARVIIPAVVGVLALAVGGYLWSQRSSAAGRDGRSEEEIKVDQAGVTSNTQEATTPAPIPDVGDQRTDRSNPQEASVDLSGLWDREGGGRLSIEQHGNVIKATFVEPPADAVSRGVKSGDTSFEAVLQGRAVEGTTYIVFSSKDLSNCPNISRNSPSQLRLEISEDGDVLEGERTDYKILPDCRVSNLPPRRLRYSRVAAARVAAD